MPADDKRPGRARGFGFPEPKPEPDAASDEAWRRSIEAKLDEVLSLSRSEKKKKRGRPRDAHADALSEVSEAAVPALEKAFEHVLEDVPLGVQVATNMPAIRDQVLQEFGRLLPVAIKAGETWHFGKRRNVNDIARAMRSARRRRGKTEPSD